MNQEESHPHALPPEALDPAPEPEPPAAPPQQPPAASAPEPQPASVPPEAAQQPSAPEPEPASVPPEAAQQPSAPEPQPASVPPEAGPAGDSKIIDSPLEMPKFVDPQGSSDWVSKQDPEPPNVRVEREAEYSVSGRSVIDIIQQGLLDPQCTQIDGYGPQSFSAQFAGKNMMLEGASFASVEEYTDWLRSLVDKSSSLINWDDIEREKLGVLDLPDGSRLTVFLPPISRDYPTFSLRKHTASEWPAEELVKRGALEERMLLFLQSCVAAHVNILFVGAMGAGKTTLMRSLLQGVGDNERIAVVEQIPEIGLRKPLVNEYLYYPTIPQMGLSSVLDYNLYNGLDRLVVGEVHMEGLSKMLETMILTEGSMSTYHAYSTEQAGERMKLGVQMENSNVSAQTAVSFIRQAIELVVVVQKLDSGRKVTQITEIDWRTSSGKESLSGGDIFIYDRAQDRFIAKNAPHLGRIESKLEKYQIPTRHDWFIESADLERFRRRVE